MTVKHTGIEVDSRGDDIPGEIDFSQGERGKFHQSDLLINLPRNRSLTFADSEVSAVTSTGSAMLILLSAAHVLQDEDVHTGKPTEGFSRGVEILLTGTPAPDGTLDSFMGRISNGRVRIGAQWSSTLSLPCSIIAPIQLELNFANQSYLEVIATGLECRFKDKPNFYESLLC